MIKTSVLYQIDIILQGSCRTCETRTELNRQHRSNFSKIDRYCNKECEKGLQLQQLGKKLLKKEEIA